MTRNTITISTTAAIALAMLTGRKLKEIASKRRIVFEGERHWEAKTHWKK